MRGTPLIPRNHKREINGWEFVSSSASNNINQIARRVNSTGNIYAEDLSEIKEQQSQILHHILKLRGEIHIVEDLVESVQILNA